MSIGRKHKQQVLDGIAAEKAQAAKADSAKESTGDASKPAIPVEVLSPRIGLANRQRALASMGKIILVESQEEADKALSDNSTGSLPAGFDRLISKADRGELEVILTALNGDLDRLKEVSAIHEKQAIKAQLLDKYLPVVHAYLTSGARYQNLILVYCVIWSIDTEQFQQAIDLADVAIEQNQNMPEYIKRRLSDFVVEEFSEWACRQSKANASASPFIDQVIERVEAKLWPVDEPIILGKLYRYAGDIRFGFDELEEALELFEKALAVNDQAGCKGSVKKIKERLNKK